MLFHSHGYIESNEIITVSDELGLMWRKAVMTYFNALSQLSQHLPGGTEKRHA
jgi:hypothetical protein